MTGPTVRLTFAGDEADLVRSMDRVGQASADMAQDVERSNADLALAGAAAGAALVGSFNQSLEFESAGALLDAQLGAGSPLAAEAGAAAGNLYANAYGESLGEVNDAVRGVAQNIGGMATASAAELEAVTGQAMSLAQVMGIDVAQATQAAGQMVRQGLARDATEAMDLLTVGAQQGANRMGDLADVFAEYAGSLEVAGLDGATAMGIMTQAMDAGAWSADLVADSIREFGILAVETGGTASEAWTTMGMDADQMAADVAAGGDRAVGALDKTLDALRAMPPGTERAGLAVQLFGTMAEDMGDSLFAIDPSQATARLGEFSGAAATADAALGETGAAKVEAMTRGFQDWAMSIAGVEGPLGTVATGVMTFGTDAVAMAGSAGMAVVAMRGLGIGTAAVTAAQWLWNAALTANPIGLVVVAIAALVGGLVWAYNSSETFREIVNGAFAAVAASVGQKVDQAAAFIGWFQNLPMMVGGWFLGMRDAAIGRATDLVGWLAGLPGRVMGSIGSFRGLLVSAGRDLLSGLWSGITGAAGWLRDKVFGFFGSLLPGWARDVLGIRSPSTKMRDLVGVHLPSGVGEGIEAGMPGLIAQATAMGDATRAAAAEAIAGPLSLGGLGADPFAGLGDQVDYGQVDDAMWNQLRSAGWQGRRGDGAERLYRPAGTDAAGLRFVGNTDSAVATLIMHLIRTGKIQLTGV